METALSDLEEIKTHKELKYGKKVASRFLEGIIARSRLLSRYPFIGQVEDQLSQGQLQYRRIIYEEVRILYSVEEANRLVMIHAIAACRKRPETWLQ